MTSPKPADDHIAALAEAMCYVLNDLGAAGHSVSPLVKALARVSFEPFRERYSGEMMSLEQAEAIIGEVGLEMEESF
jgi:hypothetical protein